MEANMFTSHRIYTTNTIYFILSLFLALLFFYISAQAQPADIAKQPIFSMIPTKEEVKPNILMVMDDSGSMSWTHMPDEVLYDKFAEYAYTSNQCNNIYYNPNIQYTPPVDEKGNPYSNQSFYNAEYDGYNTTGKAFDKKEGKGRIDLSKNFQYNLYTPYLKIDYYSAKESDKQPAFYHIYDEKKGKQTSAQQKNYLDKSSEFYKQCKSNNANLFKKVTVGANTGPNGTDERTNFANWFSYYRTRLLMMKTGTGKAFSTLNDRFRIGFMTINNGDNDKRKDFLNILDFSDSHKTEWFSLLYKSDANGSTPLRAALADAGKIYAGLKTKHNNVDVKDPVEYACQQNYTILSTDGYWNEADKLVTQLDGTTQIGNQDQNMPRPYKDDSSPSYTQTTVVHQQNRYRYKTEFFQIQKSTRLCFIICGAWSAYENASSCTNDRYTQCKLPPENKTRTSYNPTDCPNGSPPSTATSATGIIRQCTRSDESSINLAQNTCSAIEPTAGNNYYFTRCQIISTPATVTSCTPQNPNSSNSFTQITCSTPTYTSGTPNTLADTALYYYQTNLRTKDLKNCKNRTNGKNNDLCLPNRVPYTTRDTATHQHMTTFTLGLGARGRMIFSDNYMDATSGDFFDVRNGNNAGTNNCSWQNKDGKPCNWPAPKADSPETIDDLWHTAVNGRGDYFFATDPETLSQSLTSSLSTIINAPKPGTAAAAATSNPKITSNNNFQFSAYFKSVDWSGELIRQAFNLTNGRVREYNHMNPDPASYDWSAQALLDKKDHKERKIYFNDENQLALFEWKNLSSQERNYFSYNAIKTNGAIGLSQFCSSGSSCLSDTIQRTSASGETLVNYLRGERTNENSFYRQRAHVLGDIVSSQPLYIGPPNKTYTENGYVAFKSKYSKRPAIVVAGANDGMLHAFDVETGEEKWAYIPSMMLSKLYVLADKNYANKHEYFVEGTPRTSDVFVDGEWKTILVGGFNAGGTGYYALDITNPYEPKFLWEYTNKNMGYTFGNPEITKLDNGKWVVIVASGYNNCAKSSNAKCATTNGDGIGYLYILDASNGNEYSTPISTDVGNASGLTRIIAHAGPDNITKRVYGGDLQGNLWRFNLETTGNKGFSKQLIAVLKDKDNKPQPITTRPQVTTHKDSTVILVGTGRYLDASDFPSSQGQSFYAIKDNISATPHDNIRTNKTFIQRIATASTCPEGTDIEICGPGTQVRMVAVLTGTQEKDSLDNKNGWYLDFPANAGEISITDPKLVRGSITFTTSIPVESTAAACEAVNAKEPISFSYTVNYKDGGAIDPESTVAAKSLGNGIATSPQIIQLPDGTILVITRTQAGTSNTSNLQITAGFGSGLDAAKRASWRELTPR